MSATDSPIPDAVPVVAVVEDEPLIRMALSEYLQDNGFKVFGAGNALDAMVILEARQDVLALIADIELPGPMNGIGLAVLARGRWPGIAVVLTCAHLPDDVQHLPAGMPFMRKPYDLFEIAASLNRSLPSGAVAAPDVREDGDGLASESP
jgi:DNA-binding response OmpR family regulator